MATVGLFSAVYSCYRLIIIIIIVIVVYFDKGSTGTVNAQKMCSAKVKIAAVK